EPSGLVGAPTHLLDPSASVDEPAQHSFDASPPHSDPSQAVDEPDWLTFFDLSENSPLLQCHLSGDRKVAEVASAAPGRRSSKNGSLGRDWSKLVDQSTPAHAGAPAHGVMFPSRDGQLQTLFPRGTGRC
ncbi:hypothetical protein EV363DRAFT_1179603, partial [Boletus edulis]